jgi:flagellin-like hook-associated protein FlgL
LKEADMLRTSLLVAAFATALMPFASQAQTVYKSVGPDGRVTYGDEPVKGARKVERLEFQRPEPSASAGASAAPPESNFAFAAQADERLRALDRADLEIKAAAVEVGAAQRRLDEAQEPLAGERIGIANGNSRLNDNYVLRIGMLQEQLERAKQRLERAYTARNELRG